MTETFIDTALSTGVAVTALLLLVIISRRAVTRRFGARVAYALWLLPALRLIMPTIPVPATWSLSRWVPALSPTTPDPASFYVGTYSAPLTRIDAPSTLAWADIWPTAIVVLWGLGIMLGAYWMIVRQRRYARHLIQMSATPDAALTHEIARAIRVSGLKSPPTIRVSFNNDGPMVSGLWRPVIVVPANFTSRFTAEQRHLALLHELIHIRRGDLWTASAMMMFRLINWPNPLVHLAWPRFRADQEAACDAAVLRLTGETARADYAETLLTAAKTATQTSGRAGPMSGTGLTLSLHHPIKERLMTLGLSTNSRRGAGRWGLAALLLTGAALTAPLTLADGPPETEETKTTTTTSQKSVYVVRGDFSDEDKAGYEIRDEDGVKTYLRVSRDGTTETLTREQLEAEYEIDVDALISVKPPMPPTPPHAMRVPGEPGLHALTPLQPPHALRTMIIKKSGDEQGGSYEVKVEDGVRQVFRIEEDGTRTEISTDDMGSFPELETIVIRGQHAFPSANREVKVRTFTTNDGVTNWVSDSGEGQSFTFSQSGDASPAMVEGRLRAAQSMLASTDELLADLRETADGDAVKDIRSAERELEKARKALDKAQAALEKSSDR